MSPTQSNAHRKPPLTTALAVCANGKPVPCFNALRPFQQVHNLLFFTGPRAEAHEACGGGRRIVRKAEPEA